MSVNQDVRDAVSRLAPVVPLLMNADVSNWVTSPSGFIDVKRLRNDPSWVAMRDVEGLTSMLLATFELALERAAFNKDLDKASQRFLGHLTGSKDSDEYFTHGALSAGVIDTACDVGLLTDSDAEILKQSPPWRKSPVKTTDCAHYVKVILQTVESAMNRVEAVVS